MDKTVSINTITCFRTVTKLLQFQEAGYLVYVIKKKDKIEAVKSLESESIAGKKHLPPFYFISIEGYRSKALLKSSKVNSMPKESSQTHY